jgi:hypothetical protein
MQSFWSRFRHRLPALARMSWSDRALAVESLAMLAAARVMVKTTRGKNLISRMRGKPMDGRESPGAGVRVGAMLERVAPMTWWRSMCLEKALAGKWMLRRRGIPSTMYVGMAKQGGEFVAHAWLVGEGQTLTGAGETAYATLAAFHESPRG